MVSMSSLQVKDIYSVYIYISGLLKIKWYQATPMLAFEQTRPKTGQRLRFGERTTIFCISNISTKNNPNEHSPHAYKINVTTSTILTF